MRVALVLVLLLALAGCLRPGEGRFSLLVSDQENDIDDFRRLDVTLESIVLFRVEGAETAGDRGNDYDEPVDEPTRQVVLAPEDATLDLTQLRGANETEVFDGGVEAGSYKRIELHIASARGELRDGEEVDVDVPSGRVFLNQRFTVARGTETTFLFDVTVQRTGNGEYQLKPNAGESGTRGR